MEPMIAMRISNILKEKRIQPIIKVKKNSIISSKNNKIRNRRSCNSQTKDYHKWKKKRKYGQRWMAETVFSSIKRIFGEYTSSMRFQNMVKENDNEGIVIQLV